MKDYYDILGVARGATKDEIKKAYRKLAHKFHPDKSGGDETRFKEINEAYQVLSNDEKRAQYDRFGSAGPSAGFGGAQTGGWDFSNFRGFEDVDMGDIFESFFGGSGGGNRARRGRDISIDIEIPFQEAIFGGERRVLIRKRSVCDECTGTGKAKNSGEITCTQCNGAGTIRDTKKSFFGSFTQIIECAKCRGVGKVPEKKCKSCRGEGVHPKSEEVRVVIPAGIENGEVIRISKKGEAILRADSGDLYVKVHIMPHATIRRSNRDLAMKMHLPLSEALLGGSHNVESLDGTLKVHVPQGVADGEILKVRGRGVPLDDGSRGDLLLEVKIQMPKKLSPKVKALIEELKKEGN